MPGRTTRRLIAAAAVGLYCTAYEFQAQRAIEFAPRAAREFVHTDASVAVGAAGLVLAGISIGRWWALAIALVPVPPLALLRATDHLAPYHEAAPPLSRWPLLLLVLATPIALGLVLRRLWDLGVVLYDRRASAHGPG